MKKKPLSTIFISLIAVTLTFIAPLLDTSIYAFNGHPTNWMSFAPDTPFRDMGIGLITSPFIHMNLEHLAVNLFFFIPIGMMIERRKEGFYLPVIFFLIHLQILFLLIITNSLHSLEGSSFLGCSHVILGLYSFWFLKNKKYGSLLILLIILGAGLWQGQSPLTTLAHTLGLAVGCITLFLTYLARVIRLKCSH